jgi:hypothetical protein
MGRLRLLAYVGGPLSAVDGVFFERLASDPLLELGGIIVDEFQKPAKPVLHRVLRGLRSSSPRPCGRGPGTPRSRSSS